MQLIPVSIFFFVILVTNSFAIIYGVPQVFDENLRIEKIFTGLNFPVSMSFINDDEIIVLEKNYGTVHRIVNGQMVSEPLLRVNVSTAGEQGLVGSAIGLNSTGNMKVFLYYTDISDPLVDINNNLENKKIIENKLYSYDYVEGKLVNPKLLLKIPTYDYPQHIGGKIVIGPDNNLYVTIGDLFYEENAVTQNYEEGTLIDVLGGIIRLTFDGLPVKGILADYFPLNFYFAYGIRNSFGMDFDPVTGNLWDTENGPEYGDEINLVEPGFNSGWMKVQGINEPDEHQNVGRLFVDDSKLVTFDGNGKYSAPEYMWNGTRGLTAIEFLNSSNLGNSYENDIFVGEFNEGRIYHFELDDSRKKIVDKFATINRFHFPFDNDSVLVDNNASIPKCLTEFYCSIQKPNDSNYNASKTLVVSDPSDHHEWSYIYDKEHNVIPNHEYNFTASMKLNEFVNQSHIIIQGYHNKTNLWDYMTECPSPTNGPLNWTKFSCAITIPVNVSKIRPIINSGYSIETDKEATSYFKDIHIEEENKSFDLFPDLNLTGYPIFGRGFGHVMDIQVGPDGNLYVLSMGDIEEDETNFYVNNNTGTIYRIVKSNVSNS